MLRRGLGGLPFFLFFRFFLFALACSLAYIHRFIVNDCQTRARVLSLDTGRIVRGDVISRPHDIALSRLYVSTYAGLNRPAIRIFALL
jgi:hypothetical protein